MTNVSLVIGGVNKVVCTGHSGTDDICTAVSTLMQTLDGWLRNTDDAVVREKHTESGYVSISFTGGRQVMDYLQVGFRLLEYSAPNMIKVSCRELH